MRELEAEHLKEAIEKLPERVSYILIRRYGLDEGDPATLVELGEELEISREQVRLLQREAERLLRTPASTDTPVTRVVPYRLLRRSED